MASVSNSKFIIYALIDPRTNEIRYIGQTIKGLERPRSHWKSKRQVQFQDPCHSWIRNVLADGLVPEIDVIEEFEDASELDEAETFWIQYFRYIGCRLTNLAPGGKSKRGIPCPIHVKEIASRTHKGKIESAETRKKKSESHRGKIFSDVTRKKLSESISKTLKNKNEYKYVYLLCYSCQKEIRRLKIHIRTTRVFCSLSCSGKFSHKEKHV